MKPVTMLLMAALSITSIGVFAQEKAGRKDTMPHAKVYTCPTHDQVKANKPGNCPICGMKLQLSQKEAMKMAVTKNYVCPMHPEEKSDKPGTCPKCGMTLNLSPKEKMKAAVMNGYTCPMHADITSDKEGKCPKCGMKLTKVAKKTN